MGDTLIGLLIGWAVCKFLGMGEGFLDNIFHVSHPSGGPKPEPLPSSTTTVVNFPTSTPAGLPAWPSGWKPVSPVTSSLVSRAWALLSTMTNGQVKYEQGPGGSWLAFYKHTFNGKTGVTVHEPKTPLATAQPPDVSPAGPFPGPSTPAGPKPAPPYPELVPVSTSSASSSRPTLRKGSRGEAVKAWQRAIGVDPDGNFGRGTEAATKAWQTAHGLTPDGVVGHDTWATAPAAA